MSLLGTLAKVAIGVAVAKGVSGMMKKGSGSSVPRGNGGLLDGISSRPQPGGGGLQDMLGQVLGGATGGHSTQGGQTNQGGIGGLGGLLEQLGWCTNEWQELIVWRVPGWWPG